MINNGKIESSSISDNQKIESILIYENKNDTRETLIEKDFKSQADEIQIIASQGEILSQNPNPEFESLKILNEKLNEELNDYKLKFENLQKCNAKIATERDNLMAEISDLSGLLYEEAYKIVNSSNDAKKMTECRLIESKNYEKILKMENADLKRMLQRKALKPYVLQKPRLTFKKKKDIIDDESVEKYALNSLINAPITFEVNELYFDEFKRWLSHGFSTESPFISRIVSEESLPCLTFANPDLQTVAREFMGTRMGIPTIQPGPQGEKACEFMFILSHKTYNVSFEDQKSYSACAFVRNMLISITELYNYISYISQKLIKSSSEEMFFEVMRLRLKIVMTRLGFST